MCVHKCRDNSQKIIPSFVQSHLDTHYGLGLAAASHKCESAAGVVSWNDRITGSESLAVCFWCSPERVAATEGW